MKKILKYSALILTANLIAVNFALASQPANLQESFEKIKESVQEVREGTKNLITTKEQENLSPEEKEKEELNLRLQVFEKILNLSIKEAEDILSQLKALENLDEKTSSLRDQLVKEFEGFLEFYNAQKKILEKPEEIDLLKIKEIAQSFKDWRETIYLPELRMATNFLLINQQKTALEMTENRYSKIALDIKKLKKTNLRGIDKLEKSLDLAASFLKEARDFRQEAENKFWLVITTLTIETASSTMTSTSSDITTSTEKITIPDINATSTSTSTCSTCPSISIEDQFLSIKNLIGKSLNKIKETYQIFIEMSNFVKKLLI